MQPALLLTYNPDIERLLWESRQIVQTPDVFFVSPAGQVTEILPHPEQALLDEWCSKNRYRIRFAIENARCPSHDKTYQYIRPNRFESTKRMTHYTTNIYGGADDDNALESIANELDLDPLGAGHWSKVFICPWDSNKAIKIGHGSNLDGDYLSDGWVTYAAFCMKVKRKPDVEPMLPMIYAMHFSSEYFVAVMQRYECTYAELGFDTRRDRFDADDTILYSISEANKIAAMYRSLNRFSLDGYKWEPYISAMKLYRADELWPGTNDVHDGNIMFDAVNRCLVLTDPSSRECTDSDLLEEVFAKMGIKL